MQFEGFDLGFWLGFSMVLSMGGAFFAGAGSYPAVIRQVPGMHFCSGPGSHPAVIRQSICRDLDMGECESSPDLVKRVVKAVQKRKWHTVSEAVLCVAEAVANMNLRR